MASPLSNQVIGTDATGKGAKKDRPCDACRRRKSRCVLNDGQMPCVLCQFHSQECTFLQEPTTRKRKTLDDRTDLEPSSAHATSANSPAASRPRTIKRFGRFKSGTGVEEYDDLEGPSLLKKTLGLRNKDHSQFISSTGDLEPFLLSLNPSMADKEESFLPNGTLRRVSMHHSFILLPDAGTQNYEQEFDDLDAIQETVEPHGRALVALYFRIVHPSCPIIHKDVFLEKYNRSYREFAPPLLAAVYLLALQYWSYDDKLGDDPKPDTGKLESLAKKTLRDTVHRPKLSTVQAGILILQLIEGDPGELTAQIISIGYGLGLHMDASNWAIPEWEKGLRKRLGWSLYLQDKFTSLGNGRPPMISPSNFGLRKLMSEDFPENAAHEDDQEGSAEVVQGIVMFSQLVELSGILSEVLESIFSVRAAQQILDAGEDGLMMILQKAKPVQLKLREWFASLPDCLSMDSTQILKLSSVGYLRLAYLAAEVTLHRRIIISLTPSTNPQLVHICRAAARERFMSAIDFVQCLKRQHLESFWFFAAPQNFAMIATFGVLLYATAVGEERDFYKSKLREYRWTLKINSQNGARYMKHAIVVLDTNLALVSDSAARSPITQKNAQGPSTATTGTAMTITTQQTTATSGHTPQSLYSSNGVLSPGDMSSFSYDNLHPDPNNTTEPSPALFNHDLLENFMPGHDFTFEMEGHTLWPNHT